LQVADGNHFSISDSFVEQGIPYYRGQDVSGNFFIEQAIPNNIDRIAFEQPQMRRSHLQQGDVLLSIVGTVGEASLVKTAQEATCSCKLAILRPRHDLSPAYLATFLTSSIGRSLTARWKRGAVQMGLLLEDMNQIPVPRFSEALESAIAAAVESGFEALEVSQKSIRDAEMKLLLALGLSNWKAPESLSYVRRSGEIFAAERIDAEYFHPQKAAALESLRAASDLTVGDLFSSVRQLWHPEAGSSDDLVRNYDLNDALVPFLDGSKSPVARAEIASTKKVLQPGDLVVSRLRSYLREIAVVEPSSDHPMVASTEYIVLRPRNELLLPVETLLIYLRSILPQIVLKWSQDGSNHPRFDEKEILRMPVPRLLVADPMPYVIAMREAKAAKQRAGKLLDAAKRVVEIAIEDSESAALKYLEAFK
jgi:hypothetical protein